jgi:type IV fimbrial biogenesis protein FimT
MNQYFDTINLFFIAILSKPYSFIAMKRRIYSVDMWKKYKRFFSKNEFLVPPLKPNINIITRLNNGFTLVELMVTVAIVGIVAAIAAPSFQGMLNDTRSSSIANEFAASINLARSEAIKRGKQVTVCKSDITASSPTCSSSANWQNGWLIFVDTGTIGTVDGTDDRLKVGQPSTSTAVISPDTIFADYISYLPSGMSNGAGDILICVGGIARTIRISTTGRNHFSKGTC